MKYSNKTSSNFKKCDITAHNLVNQITIILSKGEFTNESMYAMRSRKVCKSEREWTLSY